MGAAGDQWDQDTVESVEPPDLGMEDAIEALMIKGFWANRRSIQKRNADNLCLAADSKRM